uniref:Lipid/polyisoprenoid-binding YceI-like domain-containing protein n=1 Tax=Roseihalotalea indica TaxID=2867963 RepID=A0AA49GP13_9BACT|nr:hypothetical protein K4G66_19795 [Tunicatimonas sp. TK19036]
MLFNSAFVLLLINWFTLTTSPTAPNEMVVVVIEEGSSLKIQGSTNISTFRCRYEGDLSRDTLSIRIQPQSDSLWQLEEANISIKVACFDCGNPMMNRDFQNLLEYEQHPDLKLSLLSLWVREAPNQGCQVWVRVRFTVAGEDRIYEVPISNVPESGSPSAYQGEQCLNITDFHLTPPKKFMGMVTVDEEVTIAFDLHLRIL